MNMVERVARAICQAMCNDPEEWQHFLLEAHAAIKAMREPTDHMRADGRDVIQQYLVGGRVAKPVQHQWQIADETWRAMCDGALGEEHENRNPA